MKRFSFRELFVSIFNLGLVFLVFDIAVDFFRQWINLDALDIIPFSAIGLIVCLIALPFLMVEWIKLPPGTHARRLSFYQGAGSLLALAVLVGNWIWREESFLRHDSQVAELTTLTLSSGGLLLTIAFGWLGKRIAVLISKKQIDAEKLNFAKSKNPRTNAISASDDTDVKHSIHDLISNVSPAAARQN